MTTKKQFYILISLNHITEKLFTLRTCNLSATVKVMRQYDDIVVCIFRISHNIFCPCYIRIIHPEAKSQKHDLTSMNRLCQTHVICNFIVRYHFPATKIFFKSAEREVLTIQPITICDQIIFIYIFIIMISPCDRIWYFCIFQNLICLINRFPVIFP